MAEYRGAWDEAGVGSFLDAVTIPVRLATRRPDGSPWVVTVWYRWQDGRLECATAADADLTRFLEAEPDVGFDVSTNEMPYRGVRGYGTADVSPDPEKAVLRSLVDRYIGTTDDPLAEWLLADDREEVAIRIDPAQVYSWDYSDRM